MHAFRLADVEVHPALNEIRLGDRVERLPPKFIDVLVVLAEHGDRVVGKAELLSRVWGDPLMGDEALSHAVWVLRKTLGDDAKRPRYIQTVPRRGYRLLTAPTVLADCDPQDSAPQGNDPSDSHHAAATNPAHAETADSVLPGAPEIAARRIPARFARLRWVIALAALAVVWLVANVGLSPPEPERAPWRLGDRLTRFDRLQDGRLLLATRSAELIVWSADRSQPDWRVRLGAPSAAAALQVDDHLYVPSDDGFLYALDAATGVETWRFMASAAIRSRPAVTEDSLLLADDHGEVVRLRLSDRQVVWRTALDGRLRVAAVVGAGHVVVADTDGQVSALDLRDGSIQWQMPLGAPINLLSGLSAVDHRGSGEVLLGSEAGRVLRLDVATQAIRWEIDTGDASGEPLFEDGQVFLLTRQGEAWMLDLQHGRTTWKQSLDVPGSQQPLSANQGLVVHLAGATVGLLDRRDGSLRARIQLPGPVDWMQAIEGGVALAGLDGQVRFLPDASGWLDQDWHLDADGKLSAGLQHVREDADIEPGPGSRTIRRVLKRDTRGNAQDLTFLEQGELLIGDASGVTRLTRAGQPRWHHALARSPGTRFQLAEGKVLFGGNDGSVHALDAESGHLVWRFDTGDSVRSLPVVVGQQLVFGSVDRHVYCVDLADGTLRWKFATAGPVHAEVEIVDGVVYVGSGDEHLYALNLDDGALRWKRSMQEWIVASPRWHRGRLLVPVSDGSLRALEPEHGEELWRFASNGRIWFGMDADDARIYFASGDGHVYAVDADTGRERWRQRIGPQAEGRVVLAHGHVFAGSPEGYLYALDAVSGAFRWRMRAGGAVFNPAVQWPYVAVGSADQILHLLRVDGAELPDSPLPQDATSPPSPANRP